MSKESDLFVNSLKASIEAWRMPPETENLYRSRLSNWKLSRGQWSAALDEIIGRNLDGKLPPIAAITSVLARQQKIAAVPPNLGWASFNLRGVSYSIRIKSVAGQWVISDLVWTDPHGVQHHMQEHVGEPVVEHIPVGATDFLISPDNPARPEPHEIPTPEEIRVLVHKTNLSIGEAVPRRVQRFQEAVNK